MSMESNAESTASCESISDSSCDEDHENEKLEDKENYARESISDSRCNEDHENEKLEDIENDAFEILKCDEENKKKKKKTVKAKIKNGNSGTCMCINLCCCYFNLRDMGFDFTCNVCACFLCISALLIGLMFFLVFHFEESAEYDRRMKDQGISKNSLVESSLENLKRATDSLYGFFEASTFVDYDQFTVFGIKSKVHDEQLQTLDWVALIPQNNTDFFVTGLKDVKMPSDKLEILNSTEWNKDVPYHYIVTYDCAGMDEIDEHDESDHEEDEDPHSEHDHDHHGERIEAAFGEDLSLDTKRKDIIWKALTTNERQSIYFFLDHVHVVEVYSPVVKTNLSDSAKPQKNQNGVIRSVYLIDSLIKHSFEGSNDIDYLVYIDGNFAFGSKDKPSSSIFVVKKFSIQQVEIEIRMEAGDDFSKSVYLPLKIVFLFIPFLICCVLCLVDCGICIGCKSFYRSRRKNRMISKVVKSIVMLDFESRAIKKITRSSVSKNSTRGLMKRLIIQVELYRKYLPPILLKQVEDITRGVFDNEDEKLKDPNSLSITKKETKEDTSNTDDISNASTSTSETSEKQDDGSGTCEKTNSDCSSNNGSKHSQSSGALSFGSNSRGSGKRNKKQKGNMKALLGSFSTREIAVMVVKIDEIEKFIFSNKKTDSEGLLAGISPILSVDKDRLNGLYSDVNSVFVDCVSKHDGDFHNFSVRGTLFSFGASRRIVRPEMRAMESALEILRNSLLKKNKYRVRISICKGMSYNGTFELDLKNQIRQFDVFGSPACECFALNSLCKKYGPNCKILVDSSCKESIKFHYSTALKDFVQLSDYSVVQKVYEVRARRKECRSSEWMYELSSLKSIDESVFENLERVWDLFLEETDYTIAEKAMIEFIETNEKKKLIEKEYTRFKEVLELVKSSPYNFQNKKYVLKAWNF